MTSPTSTDRDREAEARRIVENTLHSEMKDLWMIVGNADDRLITRTALTIMARLRALGWQAPYDPPTEAMVEAACEAQYAIELRTLTWPVESMRAALVAAAKARGE